MIRWASPRPRPRATRTAASVVTDADAPTLDARVDRLYRRPLGDFTRARNELSKELSREGARDDAARVKALKKPSVTAWGANQVVHHYPEAWAELLEATDQVRAAHAGGVADLAPALERRKRALAAAVEAAAGVLSRAGHPPGPSQLRKVGNTLDALASGVAVETPGRVVQDLEAPGFGALAGLAFASPPAGRASTGSAAPPGSRPRGASRRVPAAKAKRGDKEGRTVGARQKARADEERARKRAADERRANAQAAAARARDAVQRLEGELEVAAQGRRTAERQHGDSGAALAAARSAVEEARRKLGEAQASEASLRRRAEKLRGAESRADAALAEARATLAKALATLEKTSS